MSTADSLSISNYGMSNLYNDPAWQQYWAMSQQMGSLNNMQYANTLGTLTRPTATTTTARTSNPTFGQAGATIARAEETKTGGGGTALLLAGSAAVGAALWIASRGRTGKGFFANFKAGLKSFGKNGTRDASNKLAANFGADGKLVWAEVPGATRRMRTSASTTATELETAARNLGHEVPAGLKWTDAGSNLKGYQLEFTAPDGTKNLLTIQGDKVIRSRNITDASNKHLFEFEKTDEAFQKKVAEYIEAINKRQVPTGVTVKNIVYTNAEGTGLYLGNASGREGLKAFRTNRHTDLKSDAVLAVADKNPQVAKALEEINAGNFESWGVRYGEYRPTTTNWRGKEKDIAGWPEKTNIIIKNNEVAGIMENGTMYPFGHDRFHSLHHQFKSVFDDALNHQKDFVNVTRFAA